MVDQVNSKYLNSNSSNQLNHQNMNQNKHFGFPIYKINMLMVNQIHTAINNFLLGYQEIFYNLNTIILIQ